MRPLLVLLHRYLGLATALFLALAGLTGSLLAFQHEIDEWLNPTFYHAPAQGPLLSPGSWCSVSRAPNRACRSGTWSTRTRPAMPR